MILKNIFYNLTIDLKKQEAIDYRYSFRLKSFHICNYIERNCLKQLKFESDKFQAIGFDLRYGYEEKYMNVEPFISPNKSLAIVSIFDKLRYDNLKTDNEFREYYHDYMQKSFERVKNTYEIPIDKIIASYKELEENNFVNKWLAYKKNDKTRKVLAELYYEVTIDKFILTLKVFHDKKEVYNQVILETEPDEFAYANQIKKLVIEQETINILGIGDKIAFSLPLKKIGI